MYYYANDTSQWQLLKPYLTPPRYQLAVDRGVKLVVPKKSHGPWQDPAFVTVWNELKKFELYRSVYHYFEPTYNANTQLDALFQNLTPQDLTSPMWLDVERVHYMDKSLVIRRMLDVLYGMKAWSGMPVAIYTSASKFNYYYSNKPGWGNDWMLVVAHYGPANPVLPNGWEDWDGWQFSADKNGLGRFFGYQSASVDVDLVKPQLLGGAN